MSEHQTTKAARTPPMIDAASAPFWTAARQGRVLVQSDPRGERLQWPPRPFMRPLWNEPAQWHEIEARGRVYTYSVIHRSSHAIPSTPYVIAVVELDQGLMMTTNVVGVDPDAVHIGMRVKAAFEVLNDDAALVVFKPEGLVA